MRRSHVALWAVGTLGIAGAALASIVACSPPDPTLGITIFGPDLNQFKGDSTHVGLSVVLENRCATLDCHGQIGRPLRIYGAHGLRVFDNAANVTGYVPTTDNERTDNYKAVVGLQPELMSQVEADDGGSPERLLLLRKPLLAERHKGGQVIVKGDQAYECIVSWLQGSIKGNPGDSCDVASKVLNQ